MKKFIYLVSTLAVAGLMLASCSKDDNNGVDTKNYGPISVTAAYYNYISSSTKEAVLTQIDPEEGARLGTMIRLEGKNFKGIKKIVCNGSTAYINPNLLTETSVVFRIPSTNSTTNQTTPTGSDCDEEYRDIIWIYSNGNDPYPYYFHIKGSVPTVTGISHTIPTIGSWVTVTGTTLKDVEKVYFYNDLDESVAETTEIRQGEDGTSFQFCMPEMPEDYEGGYLIVETPSGIAASPNYFWRSKLIFLSKFYSEPDDGLYAKNPYAVKTSYYAWGSGTSGNMPDSEEYPEITDPWPAEGDGPKNPSVFRAMPYPVATIPVLELSDGKHSADGGSCAARACFNSDACAGRSLGLAQSLDCGVELFNEATPMENLAFQFDYYIQDGYWDSGRIAVTYVDAGIDFMANYHPWTAAGGSMTMDGWQTATIPMSDFPMFAGQTYNYLFKATTKDANGDYANQGMIAFYNDECDGYAAKELTNFVLYWNNLRVVPMVTPAVENE